VGITLLTTEWVEYVPEYAGNRITPDPTTLMLRRLTWPEWQGRLRAAASITDHDYLAEVLTKYVGPVANLTLPDGTPCTTGADLVPWINRLDGELFLEIERAVRVEAQLSAGLKKNWPSPSGSVASSPPTGGTAAPVVTEVSTS
jgi:hypothetical protein